MSLRRCTVKVPRKDENGKIVIGDNRRTVYDRVKALFHCFGYEGFEEGGVAAMDSVAIVEVEETGAVMRVEPEKLMFLNKGI